MLTSPGPGAQILLRNLGMKLDTLSVSFNDLANYVVWSIGLSVFICGSGFDLKIPHTLFLLKRLHFGAKADLTTIGFIGGPLSSKRATIGFAIMFIFFVPICLVSSLYYLLVLKYAKIVQFFSFWRYEVFPIISLRGTLIRSLNVPPLSHSSARRFFNVDWWAL